MRGCWLDRSLSRWNLRRFFRGEAPQPGPYSLDRRRVYILPTRYGLLFGVLLLVMLIGAINYDNSLGYVLTFLLGSVAIVGILHTYRGLYGLHISFGAIVPVFAGETVHIPVVLDNRGGPARTALTVRFPESEPLTADVPANQWARVELARVAARRGRHPVGRIVISTRFPVGLFRAWSHVVLDTCHLVYPRPADARAWPAVQQYHPSLVGDQGAGADDFAGLRGYHPGDSPRHIHWKAAAREQGLLTKRFGGDRAEELWLDWRSLPHLEVEARLARLARWIVDAEAAGLHYALWLPGKQLAPNHGAAHRHRCLEALALFEGGA